MHLVIWSESLQQVASNRVNGQIRVVDIKRVGMQLKVKPNAKQLNPVALG